MARGLLWRSHEDPARYCLLAGRRVRRGVRVAPRWGRGLDPGAAPRWPRLRADWNGGLRDCPTGCLRSLRSGAEQSAYRVEGFDHKKREVDCSGPIEVGYLTRGVTVDRVEIGDDYRPRRSIAAGAVGFSGLLITRQVFSYVEQHFSGVERKKPVERGWPPVEFTPMGCSWRSIRRGRTGPRWRSRSRESSTSSSPRRRR